METFLFEEIIFGPVFSRRLGISLGINILFSGKKICSFDCVYCECGWTPEQTDEPAKFPSREKIKTHLEQKLLEMKKNNDPLDVITFAGNGEPTLHPDFPEIIDDTITLRNAFFPKVKVAVLSNASVIHQDKVFKALKKVDDNILKLDSGVEETFRMINKPRGGLGVEKIVKYLTRFNGEVIIQSLFLRGKINGHDFDNTTPAEVEAWLRMIKIINPRLVMIYTFARNTAARNLSKISAEKLNEIAKKVQELGIKTQVSS